MLGERVVGGALVLLGLLSLSGCGPSDEQQAQEALRRGLAHAEKREFDEAVAEFTKAIQLDPKAPEPYYHRGAVYDEVYAAGLAITDFTAAIELEPDYAEAYYYRHVLYEETGEFDLAERDLARAKQLGYELE